MDALGYEFLVRMAYNCGRNFSNGADADIYRKMERAYNTWQRNSNGNKDEDDNYYDYRVTFAIVRTHVWDAINKGQDQIYDAADKEQLKTLTSRLHMEEYGKKVMDEVIEEASKTFRKNNLQAR